MHDIQNNELRKIKASPAARRIAKELGIDLTQISASGIEGRIQLEDVEKYHEELLIKNAPQADVVDEIYEIIRAREESNKVTEEISAAELPESDITVTEEKSSESQSQIDPEEVDQSSAVSDSYEEENFNDYDEDYEEADDFEFSIPPLPVYISFSVPDESIKNMLTGMDIDIKKSLVSVVVKACCCAMKKADISIYEDKVNVISINGKEFESKTAVNAQNSKISEIKFMPISDHDDVSINIWDLTNFEFTGFKKADIDTLNLFILWNDGKIIVELACDEYIMDIVECAELMKQLKKFLINPSYMLL